MGPKYLWSLSWFSLARNVSVVKLEKTAMQGPVLMMLARRTLTKKGTYGNSHKLIILYKMKRWWHEGGQTRIEL